MILNHQNNSLKFKKNLSHLLSLKFKITITDIWRIPLDHDTFTVSEMRFYHIFTFFILSTSDDTLREHHKRLDKTLIFITRTIQNQENCFLRKVSAMRMLYESYTHDLQRVRKHILCELDCVKCQGCKLLYRIFLKTSSWGQILSSHWWCFISATSTIVKNI